jgi:hypothetical protein
MRALFVLAFLAVCIGLLLLLQGCVPRSRVVHDGLETTVVDAVTKKPLPGAFVYNGMEPGKKPRVLAFSGHKGEIHLEPERQWRFDFFLGESNVPIPLWVCKEGYEPNRVSFRGGWNIDRQPDYTHKQRYVEMTRSSSARPASCAEISWED